MFCPRSTTWTPGRSSVTETGRSSSTARTGGAGEQTRASYPRSLTTTGDHSRLDAPGEPAVLVLALDQVGLGDVRGGPAPGRVGADDGRRAVLVLEVQLRQERRLGAPLVVGVEHADLAAVPAVGQQRLDHVGAGRQQGRDVVGLDLGVGGVLRVAGRQLVGADPLPVDRRLVDPVRRRVEPGADDGLVDDDLAPQQVRRPVPRAVRLRRRWRSRRQTSRRGRAARPRRRAARTTRRGRPRSRREPAPPGVRPTPAPCPATAPARARRPRPVVVPSSSSTS